MNILPHVASSKEVALGSASKAQQQVPEIIAQAGSRIEDHKKISYNLWNIISRIRISEFEPEGISGQ